MTIIALDSSGLVASVALLVNGEIRAEYSVNYKKTHSQTLLPMLDEIIRMTEMELNDIDAIAVAAGPGSFTGLRIGSATAKGLGLALNKPLIAVPTLEGLAYNCYGTEEVICPMMDARRSQVYTGSYQFKNNEFNVLQEQAVISVEECINRLNQLQMPVVFLGDGVEPYTEQIHELVKVPYRFAPAHMNRQRASSVAIRGLCLAEAGQVVSADAFAPEYLRMSQAERERAEKLKQQEQKEECND